MRGNAAVQGVPLVLASKLDASANVAAIVTRLGVVGISPVLVKVKYSYEGGSPVGKLTIVFGGVIVKEVDVTGEGDWEMDFSNMGPVGGLPAGMSDTVILTLAAAGVGVTGKLNTIFR